MALTKVSRGLLSTGIVDNSNATAITIDADESVALSNKLSIGTDSGDAFNSNAMIKVQTSGNGYVQLKTSTTSSAGILFGDTDDDFAGGMIYDNNLNTLYFKANNAERMRIDSAGAFFLGKTSTGLGTNGVELRAGGLSTITNTNQSPLAINREGNDGQLIGFYNDAVAAGAINVSGGTVSYTAFMGSHYSETTDVDILFGTVMEATGDLVENEYTAQKRLTKTQVSTTSESVAVYGVWLAPMEGGGETIAAVGASWCRINSSATVAVGDLLTSNGDGTAKVQSDDIVRSKTIGKVTSTTTKETYADGSYVVPVVLYCG
jgi:hypothetical protein